MRGGLVQPPCVYLVSPTARHEWPQWQPQDLHRIFPSLDDSGIDLMKRCFAYDPAIRISVRRGCMLLWGS